MSTILVELPQRAELFPLRSSATNPSQFLAGWTVDGQAEQIARLADVGVPVAVRDEVDQCAQVEDEDCEEDDEEGTLIRCRAA